MKRILSLFLASALLLSLFCGCASEEPVPHSESNPVTETTGDITPVLDDKYNPVGEYPIVKEELTLTLTGPSANIVAENNVFFGRWSEASGINIELDLYDNWNDQKGLIFAGSEYGDIIINNGSVADEELYGPQGILLDLTDLIEDYAPNVKKLLDDNPHIKAGISASDGAIYGLPYVFYTATTQNMISYFNGTWMENVGVTKVPETTDELYALLKAIKEQDADGDGDLSNEIPLSSVGMTGIWDVILTAFTGMPDANANIIDYNVDDDGNVVYVPAMESYKEFLKYANKLYSEGLIDPEFATQSADQFRAKVADMQVCFYSSSPTSLDPTTTDIQLSLSPLSSPINAKRVCAPSLDFYASFASITDNCDDPIAAIRMLDMMFATADTAENGVCLQSAFFGFENEHWRYTDDSKEYYEWIAPVTGFGSIRTDAIGTGNFVGLLNMMAIPVGNPLTEAKCEQTAIMQRPYADSTNVFPNGIRYDDGDGERASVLETDLFNYVNTMSIKFIMGEADIDAEWDNYIDMLYSYGLDELLAIKQRGLDKYNEAIS